MLNAVALCEPIVNPGLVASQLTFALGCPGTRQRRNQAGLGLVRWESYQASGGNNEDVAAFSRWFTRYTN